MSDARSASTIASIRVQARALAAQLAAARSYLATTRPRMCCDCGRLFVLPSLASSQRCHQCGVEKAPSVAWQERAPERDLIGRVDGVTFYRVR